MHGTDKYMRLGKQPGDGHTDSQQEGKGISDLEI